MHICIAVEGRNVRLHGPRYTIGMKGDARTAWGHPGVVGDIGHLRDALDILDKMHAAEAGDGHGGA